MEFIELRVPMHCEACERHVRNALSRMIGVESVDVDMEKQKVTVMGYVDREKVLKKVKRTMKLSEIFPFGHKHRHVYHDRYSQHSYYSKHHGSEHRPHHSHHDTVDFWHSTHNSMSNPYADIANHSIYAPYEDTAHHFQYDYDYGQEHYYRPSRDDKVTTMFSDENPNACSIM
ncbi:hypothetical protein O6H91_09G020400 [Diphasiastrum complanatum]|uniref:Uncharacterized protein n=1 Tax=Diphasiastrum complanatum TaxID=34168 RepID=A0ACC2CLV5_DIPCM|nr:hypothetical protein O6H91_09G020400 [Diphasiastrum complanatum]